MKMHYDRFEWDQQNRPKVERHGVEPSETEQVLRGEPEVRRTRKGYRLAWGQTGSGRYLAVVFVLKPGPVVRVITAREMTEREKKCCRRRRR